MGGTNMGGTIKAPIVTANVTAKTCGKLKRGILTTKSTYYVLLATYFRSAKPV